MASTLRWTSLLLVTLAFPAIAAGQDELTGTAAPQVAAESAAGSGLPAADPGAPPASQPPSAPPADDAPELVPAEPAVFAATEAPEPPFEMRLRLSGYVDFGFFASQGTGAGHVQDVGHRIFPRHEDTAWVFHGDPLSTAVNSRGEPADTGDASGASRAVTFDSVDSRGEPTFLVNEVDLDLTAALHERVWLLVSTDLIPRGRLVADPDGLFLGDFLEVDLAFANWTALAGDGYVLDVQAGKFDSVIGIEYRVQESPDRFGITPSLIARYTSGHPLGLKVRAQLFDESVNVALALTNGSHFMELFPFYDEQDRNAGKTVSGRVAYRYEGAVLLEIGVSGAFGAQDAQPEADTMQWQVDADLNFVWEDLELRAEYTRGEAEGKRETVDCDLAQCLRFQGAYGELSYRLTNWLGLFGRVDWRDADHRAGQDFLYVVDILRVTAGPRIEIDRFAIIKAEYVLNQELLGRPVIENDVFTTSLVLVF